MTPTTRKRVLRPAVFDAIKTQAEKHGGIGSGLMFLDRSETKQPVCGIGCAYVAGALPLTAEELDAQRDGSRTEAAVEIEALHTATSNPARAGFTHWENDEAVGNIRQRLGIEGYLEQSRVSFKDWAEELNVVRGVELPAEVYDALKASAEKYGGIGYKEYRTYNYMWVRGSGDGTSTPCCAIGHLRAYSPAADALAAAFGIVSRPDASASVLFGDNVNDPAVERINARKGLPSETRVTFDEWADELNVLRAST